MHPTLMQVPNSRMDLRSGALRTAFFGRCACCRCFAAEPSVWQMSADARDKGSIERSINATAI